MGGMYVRGKDDSSTSMVRWAEGEDSFEAIPEVPAGSTTGDQSWDAEDSQIPKVTCFVEVFEERKGPVAG